MTGLISWINRDFWGPVWPNLAASAICAYAAVMRVRVHLARHREASTRQHAATRDLVAALHERLDRIGAGTKESP